MKYTGERIIPDKGELYSLFKRHLDLYKFASGFVKDRIVLDIGCGEGYGPDLLAKYAEKIIAVDNSREAIEHARVTYSKDNLEFAVMDAAHLEFADDNFDAVVAIELIEHLKDHGKFLSEVRRILKPSGIFILSTPHLRNPPRGYITNSPYHFREFSPADFENALREHFDAVEILGIDIKGFDFKSLLTKLDIFKIRTLLPDVVRIRMHQAIDKNLRHKIDKKCIKGCANLIGICRKPK